MGVGEGSEAAAAAAGPEIVKGLYPDTVREDTSFQSSNRDEKAKWLPSQRA